MGRISGTLTVDTTKVPDDDERGYLIINGKNWIFLEPSTYKLLPNRDNEKQTIVLVLESPHIDEFDSNHNPIRPANGATGRNIEKYIAKYASQHWKLNPKIDYKICIVNSVQFQASCIHSLQANNITLNTKYQRDVLKHCVLIYAFDSSDLQNRIEEFHPNIVINCCTEKPDNMPLIINNDIYDMVDDAIISYSNQHNCQHFRCYHPSSKKWRMIILKP